MLVQRRSIKRERWRKSIKENKKGERDTKVEEAPKVEC